MVMKEQYTQCKCDSLVFGKTIELYGTEESAVSGFVTQYLSVGHITTGLGIFFAETLQRTKQKKLVLKTGTHFYSAGSFPVL